MTHTIAILHYAGPPTIGGVEATITAHARVLADDGWRVRLIAGSGAFEYPGVTVHNYPALGSRGERIEQVQRELAGGVASAEFAALVAELTEWLAEALAGVDVAIVHNALTLHKNLAFTAALHRLHTAGRAPRLLAWCHDFAWRDPLYRNELHAGAPWELLRQPWAGVRYVAVSEDRRAMLAELLHVEPEQITVATPGIDLAAFLKLEPETVALVRRLDLLAASPLLLLPARITRRKNIELAIAITGALREYGMQPRLVITGPPGPHNPANAAYLAQLQALASADVVFLYQEYAQPVTAAMLADLFRLADGLLFPSAYEGFGIPMIEAGLAGVPIFCSDIPPFREIAGPTAVYFDLQEPPMAIAERIAAALRADPRIDLRRRVRLGYTWDAIYRQTIAPLLRDTA